MQTVVYCFNQPIKTPEKSTAGNADERSVCYNKLAFFYVLVYLQSADISINSYV